jgi:hypothetical protein
MKAELLVLLRHQDQPQALGAMLSALSGAANVERVSVHVVDDGSTPRLADLGLEVVKKEQNWWGPRLMWTRSPLCRGEAKIFSHTLVEWGRRVEWVLCLDASLRLSRDSIDQVFAHLDQELAQDSFYQLPLSFGSRIFWPEPPSWKACLIPTALFGEEDWDPESLEWCVAPRRRVMLKEPELHSSIGPRKKLLELF